MGAVEPRQDIEVDKLSETQSVLFFVLNRRVNRNVVGSSLIRCCHCSNIVTLLLTVLAICHHTSVYLWYIAARAEDYIYDKLEKTGLESKKKERLSNLGQLGGTMLEASAAYGPGSAYGR